MLYKNNKLLKTIVLCSLLMLAGSANAMTSIRDFYEVKKERIFTMLSYVETAWKNNLYSFCSDLAKTGEQVVVWKEIGLTKKGVLDRLSNQHKEDDIFIYAEKHLVAVAVYDTDMSSLKTIEEKKAAASGGVFKSCYALRGSTHPMIKTEK